MGRTLITYGNKSCYFDNLLLQKLDNIKKILKRNWDCVFLIDGVERSGKSTLGLSCIWYLAEGKLTYDNIASDSDDAVKKCEKLPDGSTLLIDEGSLIFSSKETMTTEQKKLIKIMNVIGQKNMVFVIVLPSVFDLNKFIAVNRSRFLLHVYTDKRLYRGRFSYFSDRKKKILYEYGKRHYNSYKFPKAGWVGQFWKFFPFENEKEYFDIKKKSLFESFHGHTDLSERDYLLRLGYENLIKLGIKKKIKIGLTTASYVFGIPRQTLQHFLKTGKMLPRPNALLNKLPTTFEEKSENSDELITT